MPKVIGLDGREHTLSLIKPTINRNASKLHQRARTILKSIFPFDIFFEELALPGSSTADNGTLFADFFCFKLRLAVEVHGEQHYKSNAHFHPNKLDFTKSLKRDRNKARWFEINGIELVELPYNEDDEEWKIRLMNRPVRG